MQFFRINATTLTLLILMLASACAPTLSSRSVPLQSPTPTSGNQSSTTWDENAATTVAVVKTEKANLRDKPSRSGTILKEIKRNDSLVLIKRDSVGPWYNVRENKTGSSGWIHGNLIVLNNVNNQIKSSPAPLEKIPTPPTVVPVTSGRSYINVDGVRIPSPVFSDKKPEGATARCGDGSYSFSQHRRGTCSHHGGVAEWL